MKSPPTIPPGDDVARLAYAIWEQAGRPHGRALEHWLEAKAQLDRVHHHEAPSAKPRAGPTRKLGLIEIAPERPHS